MKYKIIVDSSSDLQKKDYIQDNIDFEVVPLTLHVDDKEFIDDENIDVKELVDSIKKCSKKPTSSCPAPGDFLKTFTAENNFCITLSSKLSGAYASANTAKDLSDKNVFVIDSKGTSGMMEIITKKLIELINENKSYDDICNEITQYVETVNVLFAFDSFEGLVKGGRMNKIVAMIARLANIKLICKNNNGEIAIFKKTRSTKLAYKSIVDELSSLENYDYSSRDLIISHEDAIELAEELKSEVEKRCHFRSIIIRPMRGLCSFYVLEKGLIISY